MAVANYEAANRHFPPAYVLGPDGRPWHSWRVLVLPYIEQNELFQSYRFDEPWDGPNNRTLADRMPKTYAFSGGHRVGPTTTNYVAVVGEQTMWPGAKPRKREEITDGTDETILVVENEPGVHWMEPRDLDFETMDFRIDNPDGVSGWYESPAVVTADDRVMRLSKEMTPEALRAALTVAGGERLAETKSGWTAIEDGRDRPRKAP